MATNTEKLGLKLPAPKDFYNIEDSNENFIKIDEHLENFEASLANGVVVGYRAESTSSGVSVGRDSSSEYGASVGREAKSTYGGGSVGYKATATTGGAVGESALTTNGGAVGAEANTTTGGAIGKSAKSETGGGAVGESATTTNGASVGYKATSQSGASIGRETTSTSGAAIGAYAKETGGGGSIGYYSESFNGGGAVGNKAYTGSGGAVGKSAVSQNGGAVGDGAVAYDGFSGGANAKAAYSDETGYPIDTIQLGAGTNSVPRSLKVYNHLLMDSDGKVPHERLPIASDSYVGTGTYGQSNPLEFYLPFRPRVMMFGSEGRTQVIGGLAFEDGTYRKATYAYTSSVSTIYCMCESTGTGDYFVSIYATKAEEQFNKSEEHYRYVAIG